ncbi:MAG TPA: VanR-ABDEGLN family response regulator transcription factor [Clostridiales bacterium]|nr:VanR-ABDEGLN family response regulator transcription factor [Clostridiales bacterium]
MSQNILIVDDEIEIADLIELYLKNDGYKVYKFYNGLDALKCIEKTDIDLAILDVMLPDINGFDLCRKIRATYMFPVIMLTAKIEDMDKITGLTMGADDYITKPFNPLEVVARVKTQLRRYKQYNKDSDASAPSDYDNKGLYIAPGSHKCILNGEELPLTPMEFDILWFLCKNHGRVVSAEELFETIWGEKYLERDNNTVMAHIARMREKMHEAPRKPKYIKTVWGVGYVVE